MSNYDVHVIVGNHDVYYKNTNNINSPELLLKDYSNIKTYSSPTEVKIDNLDILFLPWICDDNLKKSDYLIKNSKAKIAMGHLELNGFVSHRGHLMENGMDSSIFNNFERVYSGHYHTRSDNGKIFYLGNPYEMFWNDVEDVRGFHIFDTETLEHKSINNPYRLFYNLYYEDTDYKTFDTSEYEGKIVKVIVRKKSDTKKFEKFIDKLYTSNVSELRIVENYQVEQSEDFEILESEDTLAILNRYIKEAEVELDKSIVQKLLQEVYQEACEMV